jgi:DNA-binding NarL/FixJ family response regulator
VSEIRLLVACLPTMLSGIIRQAVEEEPDLRIIAERVTFDGLERAVSATRPHVLVVGAAGGALPPACARAMYERPHPGTLSISWDGRVTGAYRLRPDGIALNDLSTSDIVAAIRELTRPIPELED